VRHDDGSSSEERNREGLEPREISIRNAAGKADRLGAALDAVGRFGHA
jgi:hypothetical protein